MFLKSTDRICSNGDSYSNKSNKRKKKFNIKINNNISILISFHVVIFQKFLKK